ncbi:MAG: hypothetical protein WCO12_03440, partial [bacterium]
MPKTKTTSFNRYRKIFTGIIFVFGLFIAQPAHAGILSTGTINSCGEIASAGTYTLGSSFTATLTNGRCFVVDGNTISGTVTLDGAGYTVTASGGTLAVDAKAYVTTGSTTSGLLNGGSVSGLTLSVKNITFTGFTAGIDASGNAATSGANGGSGGAVTVATSTMSTITSNGGAPFGT